MSLVPLWGFPETRLDAAPRDLLALSDALIQFATRIDTLHLACEQVGGHREGPRRPRPIA